MANEEKKYSLISLDTGATEEDGGVRTTRRVVDGEETVVVSSRSRVTDESASRASDVRPGTTDENVAAPDHVSADERSSVPEQVSEPAPLHENEQNEPDEIPFKRMQAIIIVSLIAVIVVFFIYFNFLR